MRLAALLALACAAAFAITQAGVTAATGIWAEQQRILNACSGSHPPGQFQAGGKTILCAPKETQP